MPNRREKIKVSPGEGAGSAGYRLKAQRILGLYVFIRIRKKNLASANQVWYFQATSLCFSLETDYVYTVNC